MAHDSIHKQFESARVLDAPYSALYEIAVGQRDDGTTQVNLYLTFVTLMKKHEDDEDEKFYDAVVEVLDDIWFGRDLYRTVLTNDDVENT